MPIALNYISNALGTKIKASRIDISFFDEIQLDNVVIYDSENDTLIYIKKLDADVNLFSYWNQKIGIDKLHLIGTQLNLTQLSKDKNNFDQFINRLSSNEESNKKEPSTPWGFTIDKIDFEDTKIDMVNLTNSLSVSFAELKGNFNQFLLDESIFHLDKLDLDGIMIDYIETGISDDEDEPISFPSLPIDLIIDELSIKSNGINYLNKNSSLIEGQNDKSFSILQLTLESKKFAWKDDVQLDLEKLNVITEDGFELVNFSSTLFLSDQKLKFEQSEIQTSASNISVTGDITFTNFDQLVNNFFDTKSKFEFQNSIISKNDISYFIANEKVKEIDLNHLEEITINGQLELENRNLNLRNLSVTSGNKFEFAGSLNVPKVKNYQSSIIKFDLSKISTTQSYLNKLFPAIKFPKEINNLGQIRGRAKGLFTKNDVVFESLSLNTGIGTKISGKGKILDLNANNGPTFEFEYIDFNTNLNTLFSDQIDLPEELKRLENIKYYGALKGNLNNLIADGSLSTSLGNLDIDGGIDFNKDYTHASYDGYINLMEFDLGTMLNDTTYGIANFEGKIKGSGLNIEDLKATVDGKIKSIYYDGRTFNDIDVKGRYSKKIFEGQIKSNDKNFTLELDGKIDLSGPASMMELTLDLQNIDLKELGITDSLMTIGGTFKGRVNGNSLDEFIGEGTIRNFSLQTQKGTYFADSLITIKSAQINQIGKILSLDSPFLEAEIKGIIKPSTLIRFVKNYIKAYIPLEIGFDEDLEDNLTKYFEENEDQNFILSAKTKNLNPALVPIFGNDISIKEASLGIYFASDETQLDVKGKIDSLLYKGILFQRGSYFFDGRRDFINGDVYIEDITMDNEILVPLTTVNIVLNNKIADFNMIMSNEDYVERLNLGGNFTRTDEYIFNFKDSIFLNDYLWIFSPYNQIAYGDEGLYMQDVSLSKEKQGITLYTDVNENGDAIEILFNDFVLSELTAIIDKENDYFEGMIDGSLLINSFNSKPFVTADMHLKNITIDGNLAGNLSIEAAQDVATNSVKSSINLYGSQNQATMILDYGIESQSTVGELDIKKLEMAIVDQYLTDIFIDSEGYINGNIKINGDLNNLDLQGVLHTHEVKTTPVFTNSRYEVIDTDIIFSDTKIDFGTVELKDKNNNSAFVSGKIDHRNLRNSVVDLKVNTDNFEFLNTTENENELFYGNVNVKANVSVAGPIDDIELSGSVQTVNSSNFTISPLALEEGLLGDDFIIYGGDPRKTPSDSVQLDIDSPKFVLPFDVDLNISVEKDTKFSMIMDPITGDKIECNGNANLILKLNKNAEMKLFGNYTVTEGVYTFSYGIVNRDFVIKPESTVTFSGDPLEGALNVDAIYVANTSIFDFIKFESNLTNIQRTESQRKRDINIVLNLADKIVKPKIKLDIQPKEDELNTSVTDIFDSKLRQLREQPDELNKQVFGLLLFGNFILAQNADIDIAKTGTDIAISSVSDLIAQQLNKLADGQIAGFEVNFDVNSYSSEFLSKGQEGVITEFGFGVKKNLFDDRLTISVGTNINLESSSKDVDFNTIVGDFVLDYKILKDGSFRFKGYRKSTSDRLSGEGNSAKNGAGIYIRREFGEIKRYKE